MSVVVILSGNEINLFDWSRPGQEMISSIFVMFNDHQMSQDDLVSHLGTLEIIDFFKTCSSAVMEKQFG